MYHGMQKGIAGDELVLCNIISQEVWVTHSFFIKNIQYVTSVNKSAEKNKVKDLVQKSRQGACLRIQVHNNIPLRATYLSLVVLHPRIPH